MIKRMAGKLMLIIISFIGIIGLTNSAYIIEKHSDLFPLSIIHINDFHARFDEISPSSGQCNEGEKCIGGYARMVTKVKELLQSNKNKNAIYLNSGDNFQGTLWYNIGRWNVTQQFLNMFPADAMTLGNHDFDDGMPGAVPFLENLNSPVLIANMDDSLEPSIQGLYKKSMILERSGRKIGIIGVMWEFTNDLSSTGNLKFFNESLVIRKEAKRLREEGANIVIVLTHCGYEVDKVIAKYGGPDIDVIVGSHSHTLLWNGTDYPGVDRPGGPYPTNVYQDNGNRVVIVQASAFTKYVGELTVYFDDDGNIVNYEGHPHYLSNDIEKDPEIVRALAPWKTIIDAVGKELIGSTRVKMVKKDCGYGECNLGNFFTDSIVAAFVNITKLESPFWSDVAISIANQGSLRSTLEIGNLTYGHLVTVSPFENKLRVFSLLGKHLIDTLEYSVRTDSHLAKIIDPEDEIINPEAIFYSHNMLQVSGLKVFFNVSKPDGYKVQKVMVRCQKCDIPRYEKIKENEVYRIATPAFLADGGDAFYVIPNNKFDEIEYDMTDLAATVNYVRANSPIITPIEGRVNIDL